MFDKTKMFQNLVYGIEVQAMISMGKLTNPMTGVVEKNLEVAGINIEMLKMLLEKTKGNLSGDELNLLSRAINDLVLNYTEAVGRSNNLAN